MYTYDIQLVQKPTFGSIQEVLANVTIYLNQVAQQGWELDKMMPVEANGFTNGAILVLRKPAV